MRRWAVWIGLLLACSASPSPAGPPAHGGGLGAWVDAALWDEAAFRAAPPDAPDDPGVAGALGFGAVAEDATERAEAVAGLAAACGRCHAGGTAPAAVPLTHATAARWAADGLVWRRPRAPALDDPRLAEAIAAWSGPTPADEDPDRARVARWLAACVACHPDRP